MYLLSEKLEFPHPDYANEDGLLALGGDLSLNRIKLAYYNGIFPWFEDDDFIAWWSPKKRMVLYPDEVYISKSMRKFVRENNYRISTNCAFDKVIEECSTIARKNQDGTWILDSMKAAYKELNKKGVAHSVEIWEGEELVGGLYGVNMGKIFCGESMFSKRSNVSKLAFIYLANKLKEQSYRFIDCQMYTEHLASLGAREIDRDLFLEELYENRDKEGWDFKIT